MNRAEPYMLGRGGEIADLGGLALKAGATQTAGTVSVYEGGLPARTAGPPLHVHSETDEALYILEGEVTIRLGPETLRADAGSRTCSGRCRVTAVPSTGPRSRRSPRSSAADSWDLRSHSNVSRRTAPRA